jgi:Na+/H+-dicarboxylate symporter
MFIKIYSKLQAWHRVALGMGLGIGTGLIMGEQAAMFQPLGIIFLNLIKMITIPLIFFTLIYGLTSIESTGDIRRVGMKAIMVFLTTAMLAVCLGVGLATFLQPGKGHDLKMLAVDPASETVGSLDLMAMLVNIVPTNAIAAMAEGHILQVILFAFFTGFTINAMRSECSNVVSICHEMAQISFKMIAAIMHIAPLGVFGYMAWSVGTQGLEVVAVLGKLVLTIILACGLQYLVFGVLILLGARLSPFPFYRKMLEPQILAFATSSSKAVLPRLMDISETRLGVGRQHSRNMDGGAIYQGVCAIFFAQYYGVVFGPVEYFTLLFTCTLASIGGAGIPGGVLLFLGMVLHSVGLPIEGVVLIASVDRILDMVTTVINITGDACVTLIVARSERQLDVEQYYQ